MRVPVGVFLVSVALACGAIGCGAGNGGDSGASPSASPTAAAVIPVEVAVAEQGSLDETTSLTGHLRAVSKAQVFSRIGGRVIAVNAREGDRVGEGEALIELDSSVLRASEKQAMANLSAAQARLEQAQAGVGLTDVQSDLEVNRVEQSVFQAQANTASAKAEYDDAVRNRTRQRSLFAKDAVSHYAVEQAELRADVAKEKLAACQSAERAAKEGVRIAQENRRQVGIKESDVAAARAAVEQASAALEAVRVDLRDTILRSPCVGTVVTRSVEPGQSVAASGGSALMQVVDNSVLEMVAPLDERYRSSVRPGTSVTVSTSLGEPVQAKVVDIIPASDPTTHTIKVRLQIANNKDLLVEGAYATATLVVKAVDGVVVPKAAINSTTDATFVVAVKEGKAKRIPVKTVLSTEKMAVVTGLSVGETVIVSGGISISDGQDVNVAKEGSK